ncbi:metal ABC transporter substrate-binding protein [Robertkochia aurantiaca]|uniref:metal ABC transporter substrate-binding protein n=1 Tax=Robertkochia aurantiaca TaxID=2873700 RepID=UPI001CCD25F0|nr:metal ABC transporter substrate-binding protein [Robertkochia sp. 3YJGBD-33]
MKTLIKWLAFSLLLVGSCKSEKKSDPTSIVSGEKPVVYVSNYPIYFFASEIAGENIELRFPAAELSDPSVWNPVADTIAQMQSADLILVNGASFESWLMNVSLPQQAVVNTSQEFSERLLSGGKTFTHSHGDEGEHQHEGTAFTTWLNLELAAKQAESVKEALTRLHPEKKSVFEENYRKLAGDLMQLHKEFQHTVAGKNDKTMVFSHPVYQYLEDAYGIQGKSLHWEPDTPLDHDMLHEIGHLQKDHRIEYVIWEGEPLAENVEKLKKMGIQSVVITPMGGAADQTNFMEGMRKNLEALKEVYGIRE